MASSSASSSLPATLHDPKSLFFQKVGIRRAIIASYWTFILLAVPLWWYTTSIERLALPSGRVQQLAKGRLQLPITICVEGPDIPFIDKVQIQLSARIDQDPQRWKDLVPKLIGSTKCEKARGQDIYVVKFHSGTGVSIDHRRLQFPYHTSPSIIVDSLTSLIVPHTASGHSEHRIVQYSPHYRMAFSLLNEDATAGDTVKDWDIQAALTKYVTPISHRLSALHNFTIESQVQFYAPLAFTPRQLNQSWGITPADLSVFVNSAEWTLSSSSSNDPVLHFILFIPSAQRRPLRILVDDNENVSPSSAFLVPQWGGIVIHNPPSLSASGTIPTQDLHTVFSSFASQLQSLLGVAPLPRDVTSPAGLSDWQLDALTRRRTLENAQSSQDTLISIIKLVDQIENMPVGADVRDDVENALEALSDMYAVAPMSLANAFAYSAKSFGLASRAFFNPGMLALLYFPAEHTYAVYTPLFASALIPLIVAALRELLAWRHERREKKAAENGGASLAKKD